MTADLPLQPCVPVWYMAPPLFIPLQTCGSKDRKTGIQPSQAVGLRGLFVVLGWRLSASIPFWSWLECPHLRWKFPISVGFSSFYGLASISSRTPFGYVCVSIHQRSGGMFPCLPACISSPSRPHRFRSTFHFS